MQREVEEIGRCMLSGGGWCVQEKFRPKSHSVQDSQAKDFGKSARLFAASATHESFALSVTSSQLTLLAFV
jgi:hypothetical protein